MNKQNMTKLWKPFTPNKAFNEDPLIFVSSDGMYYTTDKGDKELDACSALWCCNLGHNNKNIINAIKKQAESMYFSPSFNLGHPLEYELAEELTSITPDNLNHVFFANSGSEAVDTSLKMALAYQKAIGEGSRTLVIGRQHSYHGVNFGGTSVGGLLPVKKDYNNLINAVHIPTILDIEKNAFSKGIPKYGKDKAQALQETINIYGAENIAALIIEAVAGSGGVHVPPVGYLEEIEKICKANGILLIIDEVITGFGRLGTPFAVQRFGIDADIITLAKGLTNGAIPMGAVVANDKVYNGIIDNAKIPIEFLHGYTYSGHPIACAAGIASIKTYKEDKFFDKVLELEDFFQEQIHTLKKHKCITDIRNIGLMGAIEFSLTPVEVYAIFKRCFNNSLLIRPNGNTIALSPSFIVTKDEIITMIEILSNAIDYRQG
jgi:beta-alanine--pyruvate transaminase